MLTHISFQGVEAIQYSEHHFNLDRTIQVMLEATNRFKTPRSSLFTASKLLLSQVPGALETFTLKNEAFYYFFTNSPVFSQSIALLNNVI